MSVSIHRILADHPRIFSKPMKRKRARRCANPPCEELTYNLRYCSRKCTGQCAGRPSKRRGVNPDRHIRVRLADGSRKYLHILKAEEWLGRAIDPDTEIVHHLDGVKHHNCTPIDVSCGSLFCNGNLEVLTGDARREHIKRHQQELYRARWIKGKREGYNFDESPFG